MKPNWEDAPEWANWLAMDADGEWYWFEEEPEIEGDGWDLYKSMQQNRHELASAGRCWTQSLERKPGHQQPKRR